MKKQKKISLVIGHIKLWQVKDKKTKVITHPPSMRWESLLKKQPSIIRLYDSLYFDSVNVSVKKIEKVVLKTETVIRIEIDNIL